MSRLLQRAVLSRRWATFVVMGLCFLAFGIGTLNLFYVAQANFRFVLEHGWLALTDGGARQLLEIVITGYLSMVAYVLFKVCEYRLVHALADPTRSPKDIGSP